VIKTLEANVGQFLLGCKCPVSQGIVLQEQNPFGDPSRGFGIPIRCLGMRIRVFSQIL
jgi:hypothetical protein